MTRIVVDGTPFDVEANQNLLSACLSAGLNLPYFCWHPAMGSVGACRQCAVKQFKNETDRQGRLVMACMTPAADGTRLSIEDAEARAFRASVVEWLMINHPHDCPVCDEGGECHLQDMTVMTGHTYRRYRFPKRTYRNQDLGPFIKHDMNRCIQCYRCVRFYRDYAGGRDLNVFGSHDAVYFGRERDGVLENEFSGNLVEVCPTGVFVDHTLFQHYTRKWDLQSAQSICPHCSLGCNTTPGERYGILRRVVNRYHHDVNGYFLCDRGRFGYGYVNDDGRIRRPLLRSRAGAPARPEGLPHVLHAAAEMLAQSRGIIGIGSPRASLEANVALRTLVGPDRFSNGMNEREGRLLSTVLAILRRGPVPAASLREAEESDAVLVLGADLLNEAGRLALALLQSVRQQPLERVDELNVPRWDDAAARNVIQGRKGPLYLAGHRRTWLHDHATESYFAAPDDVGRLGYAVAHAIDREAPFVPGLSSEVQALADRIATSLSQAKRPLIVAGTGTGSQATVESAANVAWALHRQGRTARIAFVLPEWNSLGVALLGDRSLEWAMERVARGEADTVIVLENDLYGRMKATHIDRALDAARHLLVLDAFEHRTAQRADVIFPAATAAESDGTVVNNEGRAQRFFQVFVPEGDIAATWRWIREMARASSLAPELAGWQDFDDAVAATTTAAPEFSGLREVAPSAKFRLVGQKVPRQPERYSGRTAMLAHLTVHEPPPPPDADSALAFSMEGFRGTVPSPLIPQVWAPGWNSTHAWNKYQEEVGGPLRDSLPGLRVIGPTRDQPLHWFTEVPRAFQPDHRRWLVLPLAQLFGSDELSVRSPSIAERIPSPRLALHPSDFSKLRLDEERVMTLSVEGNSVPVALTHDPSIPIGTVGLFLGREAGPPPRWIDLPEALGQTRRAA